MRLRAALAAVDELVPGGADADLRATVAELDVLARWKYDGYDGYGQGRRFWEHAVGWLRGLDGDERAGALRLVRRRLVFVSRDELAHLVRIAYPDHLRPALLRRLARGPELDDLVSGLGIVGLSDGARLDLLRRATPELRSSQFALDHRLGAPDGTRHVVAVDDFSGTGGSLLRDEGGRLAGRLAELHERLPAGTPGSLLVYLASARAARHLRRAVPGALRDWDVVIVQELPEAVDDDGFARALARRHHGVEPAPEEKGGRNAGYREGELPLVLHHNTPNDSLAPLWAPPGDGPDGVALFPRCDRLRAGEG